MCLLIMLGNVQLVYVNESKLNSKSEYRDHVDWDQEQEDIAKEKVSVQLENPVPEEEQGNN